MKKIKEMGHELIKDWIKLITSDTTSEYIDKGFGFTIGSITAITGWLVCTWTIVEVVSIIKLPFKLIKKLLKK